MTDIIERQREIVARHIRGENEHDWATVYDTFVQDDRAHYDVVPLGAVFKWHRGCAWFLFEHCGCVARLTDRRFV
jgi:hypothetical protein